MVRIITDSAADFEPFELEKLNISCIPLKVLLGGTEYEENINLSKTEFYDLLRTTGEFPKTAQASPQVLTNLFKEAAAAGFVNLKGHRLVGGMRASIYNAMPYEGVVALVDFMKKFAENNPKA